MRQTAVCSTFRRHELNGIVILRERERGEGKEEMNREREEEGRKREEKIGEQEEESIQNT